MTETTQSNFERDLSVDDFIEITEKYNQIISEGIHITISYTFLRDYLFADVIIHEARGKGDQAMQLLGELFQEIANKYQTIVKHFGNPGVENQAMEKLFYRTTGYIAKIERQDGLHFWEKTFYPQNN